MRKQKCKVPNCKKQQHKWPSQPFQDYCYEHLFIINHAIIRGDAAEVKVKLGLEEEKK